MGMVRYILALAVIVHHFNVIFGTNYWLPVSSYHAVGGFFALSGFLVYGSYRRSPSLVYYTKKRAQDIAALLLHYSGMRNIIVFHNRP